MNKLLLLVCVLLISSCTKTSLIQLPAEQGNSIISKTSYTDGNGGGIESEFLSSDNKISFSQNLLEERDTLEITFITQSQNLDSLVWVFQGAEPILETANASYTVSTTHYLDSKIEEQAVYGGIKTSIPYSVTVPYRVFGNYDVFHGASNSFAIDTSLEEDYVMISYNDDRENWEVWNSGSANSGWVSPPEGTFSVCMESLVGFHTNQEAVRIKKPFTGFGTSRKNLIFEFKYDFQIFPSQDTGAPKLGVSMYPSAEIPGNLTAEDIPNLWDNGDAKRTEFRQVIVELPQVEEFTLVFTKYPGEIDEEGLPIYPFTACIRNIRIVPLN